MLLTQLSHSQAKHPKKGNRVFSRLTLAYGDQCCASSLLDTSKTLSINSFSMCTQGPATLGPSEQCRLDPYSACWYITNMGKCKTQKDHWAQKNLRYILWDHSPRPFLTFVKPRWPAGYEHTDISTELVQPENIAGTKRVTEAQGRKITYSRSYNLLVIKSGI